MKVRLAALSITLVASANISSQSVHAEGRGARFTYAPNIFKLEQPRMPKEEISAGAPSRPAFDGKVPRGSSFLGVDPGFLTKPAPRPVLATPATTRTQVAMRPSVAPTSIRSPFSPNFGEPTAPPAAAHPGMLPNFGSPAGMHPNANSSNKAVSGKLLPHQSLAANRSVSGRLLHRRHAPGQSANPALALKPIETYGNQFFTPGRCLPISGGSGMTTQSNVFGQILKRKH